MRRLMSTAMAIAVALTTAWVASPAATAAPGLTSPTDIYLWEGPTGCDSSAYLTAASNGTGPHLTSVSGSFEDLLQVHNRCGMTVEFEVDTEAIGTTTSVEAGKIWDHTIDLGETYFTIQNHGGAINVYITAPNSASAPSGADGKSMNQPQQTPRFADTRSVKRSGSVVLMQKPLVLASGQTATPRVTFTRASDGAPLKGAGDVRVTKSGKVIARMHTKHPTVVTLSLSAPATGTYAPYRGGMTWLVW